MCVFALLLYSPIMLLSYVVTAGGTVSGGLIFGTILARPQIQHKNHKINELDFQCFV